MKKIFILIFAICIMAMSSAQTKTADYLKKIPALPKDSCNASRALVENFVRGVSALSEEVVAEIEGIRESVDSNMESNAGKAEENVMKQMSQMYGMSQADIDKMKNSKNMSAADKQAIANKMLSQQANMTMDEAKNLSKMSEAGRQAYTEAYATEAMANAKNNPGQAARNNYAGNLFQANVTQQAAYSKITEINSRIAALYSPIQNDPEMKKMLDRIQTWNNKLTSMMGIVSDSEARVMDSIGLRIKNEKIAYCNRFTPQYRAALRKHIQIVRESMPEYRKFGEISAETTKAQTNIDLPAEAKELSSLEAIGEYLKALQEAYRYKLYYTEDN